MDNYFFQIHFVLQCKSAKCKTKCKNYFKKSKYLQQMNNHFSFSNPLYFAVQKCKMQNKVQKRFQKIKNISSRLIIIFFSNPLCFAVQKCKLQNRVQTAKQSANCKTKCKLQSKVQTAKQSANHKSKCKPQYYQTTIIPDFIRFQSSVRLIEVGLG